MLPVGSVVIPPTGSSDFERFNLRHLRYFLAVADAGSFRAASAKLNIAQSAVSRRVADLEAIFGVQLFDRHPRGIALSDAGVVLREGALRIAAQMDAARAALQRVAAGTEGLLRIGLFGTASQLAFVPPLIARFRDEQPHIRLELSPIDRGEVDEADLAMIDVAIYENSQALADAVSRPILASRYIVAVPRGHPLAALPVVPFDTLCDAELIGIPYPANPPAHDRLIAAAAARGRSLTIIHETASECARLSLAAAGMGIAIVSPLANRHDQGFDVEYRPLSGFKLPFELWLAIRATAPASAAEFAVLTADVVAGLSR